MGVDDQKIYVVTWNDSEADPAWNEVHQHAMKTATPCVSAGMVVSHNDTHVTLLQTMSDDGKVGAGRISIPLGCIRGVYEVTCIEEREQQKLLDQCADNG